MCIFLNIQNHDFVVFGKIREKWAHFSALAMHSSFQNSGACRNVIGADSEREPNREAPTKYSCMGEIVRPLSATGGERLTPLGDCPPFGALKTLKPLLHVWKYVASVSKWQRSDRRSVSNPPNSPRSPRALFSFLFYFMSPIGDFFLFFGVLRTFLKSEPLFAALSFSFFKNGVRLSLSRGQSSPYKERETKVQRPAAAVVGLSV